MKTATTFLAGLFLIGSLTAANSATAADNNNIEERVPLTAGTYCHEKFPAIQGRTLGTDDPQFKKDDDTVDYYGPCDEKPAGKDQQWEQKLDQEQRENLND